MSRMSESAKMNMIEISMKEFKQMIIDNIELEMWNKPILCLGKSGIGKTEVMMQVAKEKQCGYVEMRLVNYTETDIIGVPVPKEEGGQLVTKWAQMGKLPIAERDGERGILVLDEVTSAAQSVRAAAFQLMDASRSVGDYKLPDGWLIIALGNGPEDGGVFQGLEAAFFSRCMCVRVDPSLESWKAWAIPNQVHPSVLGFVNMYPDEIWNLNLEAEYGAEVYPCPRSWAALSELLKRYEKKKEVRALDEGIVRIYASSAVGVKTGSSFSAFYAFQDKIKDFADIADGKIKPVMQGVPKEVIYLQSQSIVYGVTKLMNEGYMPEKDDWTEDTYKKIANCVNYIIDIADTILDAGLALFRDLTQNYNDFARMIINNQDRFEPLCPRFNEFVNKNTSIFKY